MNISLSQVIYICAGMFSLQAATLYLLGQPAICTCGYVKIWEGVVMSSGNSQHLIDWYTFSHIIHGVLFYALFWKLFPKMPVSTRLLFAFGLEVGWEILENTPWVIEHYREQALAQGYVGDSIINSLSDTGAMVIGYIFASRASLKVVVLVSLLLEVAVGYQIRDNLTLNVINWIHQFDFIWRWQNGS